MPIDFAGADKKLRQAELLCDYLRWQSAEIAKDMRRIGGTDRDYQFALETFFSASLNAVQSAFYVLDETGGPAFKQIYSEWRNKTLDQSGRTRFNALMNLRGRDVHFGELPAEALAKMVPREDYGNLDGHHYNAAIFGPRYMTEHMNPDGTVVRAYGGLQRTVGLYVEISGQRIEATTACTEFIAQLRSLVQASEFAAADHDRAIVEGVLELA